MVTSVVLFAGIAILLLAIRAASEIIAPVLMAFVLAICTTPFLNWFIKKGLPAWLAMVITIGVDVLVLVGLVWMISSSVQNFSASIDQYDQRFAEIQQNLGPVLDNLGIDVNNMSTDDSTSPRSLLEFVAGFVGGIVSGLSNWGLIIMTGIFFLVEAISMPKKIENLKAEDDPSINRIMHLNQGLRQYMIINAGVGALAAVVNTIFLGVMGIEFAVLWGVLSFFFSFVPNVGFIISVIPPAIMALIQFGWERALIVVAAYVIINFVVDSVIKPRFIQEGVNISVAVTFVSLVIWGWVLGPIGAILAVPMSIIVQAILNSRKETRWLAYMMGSGEKPFNPEKEFDDDDAALEAKTA
jgi:predicted PurR-regulated permease PerM